MEISQLHKTAAAFFSSNLSCKLTGMTEVYRKCYSLSSPVQLEIHSQLLACHSQLFTLKAKIFVQGIL